MQFIRLIEKYPFKILLSTYIFLLFLIVIFISMYANANFLITTILMFLYNLLFFIIMFLILIFYVLKINIRKNIQILIYVLMLTSIIGLGKLYKIDQHFSQSFISIATMKKV